MSDMINLRKWTLVFLPALALGYFGLQMVPTNDGVAELSWSAPTQSENDEPLTDLAGYNIYCWADAGRYTNSIHVDNPSITSYVIQELEPGTYLCAISAVNEDGEESALSNVVAKTIQ